ncbi:HNH endonuclease [Roseomonas sp. NAR14]|uniref:HNH endonuclease n=1 Tax=Roseomonas acroporae TaxID=2937791 RepID=A0A9X1YFC3_9PROT|nr:HNH endonuclease signature motif containing protein [Roseomonas acroporae]MCK8788090.1 HNH endonuclease [Roseomonas acroporae]
MTRHVVTAKVCIMCGEEKPRAAFYTYPYTTNQGKRSVRLESRCIPCSRSRRKDDYARHGEARRATARRYKDANREAVAAQVREYRTANIDLLRRQRVVSEQKRRAGARISSAESRALIERVLEEARFGDRYLDAYTGELIDKPEIDHIVPLKAGGEHVYENLCVTSGKVNRSKHARPLLLWMASR